MTSINTILTGWAVTFGVLGMAALAVPAIAQKAESQRTEAHWESRAAALTGDDADVNAVDNGFLSRRLAETFLNPSLQNPIYRDQSLIQDVTGRAFTNYRQSKNVMAQHRCLSEAIYSEARSEQLAGQKAVAEVVFNRIKSKHYPITLCGVVYEGAERTTGCQFSFTCDGSTAIEPRGKYWDRSQRVATLAITKGFNPVTDRATHYHTHQVNPPWSQTLKMTKTIGSHKFYRFKWRERPVVGVAAASVAPPI